MVAFCKMWKKYNEIQLTKNEINFNNRWKIIPPPRLTAKARNNISEQKLGSVVQGLPIKCTKLKEDKIIYDTPYKYTHFLKIYLYNLYAFLYNNIVRTIIAYEIA